MSYTKLAALEETGYVVLDRYDQARDPPGVARHHLRRLEVLRRHPLRPAGQRVRRPRVQRVLAPHAAQDRQGRRLGRGERRQGADPQGPRRGARRQHRPLPGHRAAAQHLRRDRDAQPAPRRQQPAQPRGHRLDRPRLLQPHRRPRLGHGAARGQGRPVDRDADPAARRRAGHRRHPAALPRGLAPGRASRGTASSRRGSPARSWSPTSRSTTPSRASTARRCRRPSSTRSPRSSPSALRLRSTPAPKSCPRPDGASLVHAARNSSYDPVEVTPLHPDEVARARDEALAAIKAAGDLDELKAVRLAHAGDRSPLALANREIGALPPQAKAEAGKRVGVARADVKKALEVARGRARGRARRDRSWSTRPSTSRCPGTGGRRAPGTR